MLIGYKKCPNEIIIYLSTACLKNELVKFMGTKLEIYCLFGRRSLVNHHAYCLRRMLWLWGHWHDIVLRQKPSSCWLKIFLPIKYQIVGLKFPSVQTSMVCSLKFYPRGSMKQTTQWVKYVDERKG